MPSTTAAQVKVRLCGGPSVESVTYSTPLRALRELFLERGLVVRGVVQRLLDLAVERVDDRARDLVEPVLDVERGEHRLHQRREDVARPAQVVRYLAALLEPSVEPELGSDDRTGAARDDVRANLRKLAFGEVRVSVVQRARDDEAQDAVAEELEPLVRLDAIVGLRGMAEDLLEPSGRQLVDQPLERGRRRYWCFET